MPKDRTAIAVLKALAYFDLFHYPLTKTEINQYLGDVLSEEQFDSSVDSLIDTETIFLHSGFYSLQNNPLLAYRRIQGNRRATELLPKAMRIGKLLHYIPFVTGIGISGSLSKNFADERSDIDFFVITRSNRLWIARTIMHLVKKLSFLIGKQHWFCMNYYVDEQALMIQEQNIFTAIEIKTLLPVRGQQAFHDFFKVNGWTNKFLPACQFPELPKNKKSSPPIKTFFEWCMNNKAGDWLDNFLHDLTNRRWLRKTARGKKNEKGLQMGLITGKHFARSNPGAFQEKVLARYKEKLSDLGIVII